MVDAELPGGVGGDEAQGVGLGGAAVFDGLGGLEVEAAGVVGGIGVEGHEHAALVHERAGVGDGVEDLELVRPPIGEGGGAGAVAGDLVGHLVAFEDVLEGGDADVEGLHGAEEGEDFVLAIGVAMDEAGALEDLGEGLEFEVATRGGGLLPGIAPALPFGGVVAGGGEAVDVEGAHAHARLGEAGRVAVAGVGLLHVLAEGELDAGGGVREDEPRRGLAVAELDDAILAADGVGGPVEEVDGGDAPGELLVDVLGLGVDDVGDAHHGGAGKRSLVHRPEDHGVRVAVDDAGRDVPAGCVDHQDPLRQRRRLRSDRRDATADGQQGAADDALGGAGPEGGVAHEDGGRMEQGPAPGHGAASEALVGVRRLGGGDRVRRGGGFGPRVGLGARRRELEGHPVNPHGTHVARRREVGSVHDGEEGALAGLDGPEPVGKAAEPGRHRGQCREGVGLRQPAVDRGPHVASEVLAVGKAGRRQGHVEPGAPQHGGVFRRPVPLAEQVQRHGFPVGVRGQLGGRREDHRDDEGRLHPGEKVRAAPFLARREDSG